MNIIDFLAFLYFLLDLIFSRISENVDSYSRFFKIMYVIRLWKFLKKLEYMKIIKYVFKNTYISFIFILFLNVISISIYSILGMQLYKHKFDMEVKYNTERNFNSFEKSFMTVFSIITMDNWAQEFSLLYVLTQAGGTPLSRSELLRRAWPDAIDNPRTIDTHVLSLRKKIEVDPRQPSLIQTVRNVGYRFNIEILGVGGSGENISAEMLPTASRSSLAMSNTESRNGHRSPMNRI